MRLTSLPALALAFFTFTNLAAAQGGNGRNDGSSGAAASSMSSGGDANCNGNANGQGNGGANAHNSGSVNGNGGPQVCCPEDAYCLKLGTGCAPSGYCVPTLTSERLGTPGGKARIVVDSPSTPHAFALVAIGWSSTFSPEFNVELPYDLSAVGFPGCTLYSSADAAIVPAWINGSGRFMLQLSIPNVAKYCGTQLAYQAFIVSCANQLLTTNGLDCQIGR